MELWNKLSGAVSIKAVCAEPERLIADLTQHGFILHNVRFTDSLTVTFSVSRQDYQFIKIMISAKGGRITVLGRDGIHWIAATLKRRPVLLAGIFMLILLSLYIPSRIFIVEVSGNSDIPANLILSRASECGIEFGASRRTVRSEKVKNALLESIPQLQWVGVNTSGCVAVIRVQERSIADTGSQDRQVTNIVAATDAIIRSCTVIKGTPLCVVGQAVKKGDVLISGYTDCGLLVKAGQADGEIIGETSRKIAVISPVSTPNRGEVLCTEARYYLQIGKNIIKFSKDSGISDATCVKMYESRSLALPGGFQIPVAIIKETCQYYSFSSNANTEVDEIWLQQYAKDYLTAQMIAGRILQQHTSILAGDGFFRLDGQYTCLEVIGRIKHEEILRRNG